jgi:NAD(P)H dehydrogenase (quinone)
VARDDVADAAVAVLTEAGHDGHAYTMTGGKSLTLEEWAALLGESIGREITYKAETIEEAYASRADYGAPDWEVEGWVTSYVAIARGELDSRADGPDPPGSLTLSRGC